MQRQVAMMLDLPATDVVGHVAHIEPLKQWGYLHGPVGERVYFHSSVVLGGIAELKPGDEVCYHIATGGDQLCATQIVRCVKCGR